MKRDELLTTGTYASCPLAVLARTDLPPTAKLVYTAILAHLANGNEWVYPGVRRLMAMTGAGRSAVLIAIDQLERAELIQTRRTSGKATRYSFLPPTADPSRMWTRPECGPVQNVDRHPSRKWTATGPESGPELLNGTTPLNNTPHASARDAENDTSDAAASATAAIAIAEAYRRDVLPGDRTCSPHGRAVRNVAAILRRREATDAQLLACVANYASAMDAEDRPAAYRKAGGNFFGRDAAWREWTEPLTAAELERRRADATHRNNAGRTAGTGPGRGGFHAPSDFTGRTDAIDA